MTHPSQHDERQSDVTPLKTGPVRTDIHSPEGLESAAPNSESPESPPLNPELQARDIREKNLRWQSSAVLLMVLPAVATSVILQATAAPANSIFSARDKAIALGISAFFATLVLAVRAATPFAAITGGFIAASLYFHSFTSLGFGRQWYRSSLVPLFAVVVLTYAATKFRRRSKQRLGLAEPRRGRSASQVAANLGVAALVGVSLDLPFHELSNWAFAAAFVAPLAALAEAAADTVSSEIGQAFGGRPHIGGPWLITTFRRAAPGTDGAISTIGTHAGILAAGIVVLVAALTMQLPPRLALIAWAAGIVGLFVDSYLGATLERRNYLNNDAVNFLSTLAAALTAALIASHQ